MTVYRRSNYTRLAKYAGVTRRTLYNWLILYQESLRALGVRPNAKILSPSAVRIISETLCIDMD